MLPFSVQERDIDLLLIELLHTSPSFIEWLAARLNLAGLQFHEAKHSVSTALGETDVMAVLASPSERVAIMIENKIGAPMQPRQRERYHERGNALRESGKICDYRVILCAPGQYHLSLPLQDRWQHHLSFEDIAAWLAPDDSPSARWKARVLTEAQSKAARARQADDKKNVDFDPKIAELKVAYRRLVGAEYPELVATEQPGPDREYFLKAKDLPPGVRLKHSFFKGQISLILERKWAKAFGDQLSASLPPETWTVSFGSELHLRKAVEVMDPQLPLEQQLPPIRAALDAIVKMAAHAKAILRR